MSSSEKLDKELLKYLNVRNVVGFSKGTRKRIKDGKEVDEDVIKIYVNEKLPEAQLRDVDILPKEILGIPVDVVEKKQPKIFYPPNFCSAAEAMATSVRNVMKYRPILPGTSIGNIGITAGTFGWYAQKDGQLYIDSNAHVFHENPSLSTPPAKLDILQPGKYDGGNINDKVANYVWHQSIANDSLVPSTCPIGNSIIKFLNLSYIATGRRTRFSTFVRTDEGTKQLAFNKMDYSVAKLVDGIDYEFRTLDFDVINKYKLVGKLFAGSDDLTIACKVKYQLEAGYIPFQVETAEVKQGDVIRKSGRTTGDTQSPVEDVSALMKVGYGNFTALFDDVFVLGPMSAGGDSGSSMWKIADGGITPPNEPPNLP